MGVKEALANLVAKGWLTATGSLSGYRIYGLNNAEARNYNSFWNSVNKAIRPTQI
jgi:hypothetical protein